MTSQTKLGGEVRAVYDVLVVGGGSAGCVLASRISADPRRNVALIESGRDTPPGDVPADIAHLLPHFAFTNPEYLWSDLKAQMCDRGPGAIPVRFEQARVMGGGSSINGHVALRGGADDYDHWEALGAHGWSWRDVLPYFRRLEHDLDFSGPMHGDDGPIVIHRHFAGDWDAFTQAAAGAFDKHGLQYHDDMNASVEDGYAPVPLSTSSEGRVSTAIAYLTNAVRARPNLTLLPKTTARRLIFDGTRVTGVEIEDDRGGVCTIDGREVIVSCGAIFSPALLMRSGVGPHRALREVGIPTVADVRGVGANLQEHAAVNLSAYLVKSARRTRRTLRHNLIYARYSSGLPGCLPCDMILNVMYRSAWHSLGQRLATLQLNLMQPFSRGAVTLDSSDVHAEPRVRFSHMSDTRDRERMMDGMRLMAKIMNDEGISSIARCPFPSAYTDRVRRLHAPTVLNKLRIGLMAHLLDVTPLRAHLVRSAITRGITLADLLADDEALEAYVAENANGTWHAAGTCRMGAPDDPRSVVDPHGKVRGVEGLRVADASVMPQIPRANTNIPTIMIAEKIADAVLAAG